MLVSKNILYVFPVHIFEREGRGGLDSYTCQYRRMIFECLMISISIVPMFQPSAAYYPGAVCRSFEIFIYFVHFAHVLNSYYYYRYYFVMIAMTNEYYRHYYSLLARQFGYSMLLILLRFTLTILLCYSCLLFLSFMRRDSCLHY